MIKFIFWFLLFSIGYTYFGYPILMAILLKIKRSKLVNKAEIFPPVSIVIAAYNEEKNIGAKISDVLNLDYPSENLEIIVVSDVSTDQTDEIVKSFAGRGVKLVRLEKRSGKIDAYRNVLPDLKGEIIVFSDATSLLDRYSIGKLISNFNDPTVGCVGGLLMYINPKNALVGKGERKYWSYEKRIREYESRLDSLPSVSGTLYAVRKELFPRDMKEYLADDLIIPLIVKKKGYRTVFEKCAICKDFTTITIKEEMAKRVRITVQNIRGLLDQLDVLNFFKYGIFSLLVFSHKVLRLLVPVFLLVLFISNVMLIIQHYIYSLILLVQLLFYVTGIFGHQLNKKIKLTVANTAFYFCLSNISIFIGILEFIKGNKVTTWETVRT
jgi:cellulose synthase/poly-beta-1,6-N-acetylglucosamine synthase-like glycosyltransferase